MSELLAKDASAILTHAAEIIRQRGIKRDKLGGERSMATCCSLFYKLTGQALTEKEGWQFMMCLKLARMSSGRLDPDDYIDLAAYTALCLESVSGDEE